MGSSPGLSARIVTAGALARTAPEGIGLALIMLALDRAGSLGLAGALGAMVTLPQIVTGPLVGSVLDRVRRPTGVVAAATLVNAGALVAIALDGALGAVTWVAAGVIASVEPALTGGLSASLSRLDGLATGRIAALDAIGYNVAGLAGPALVTVLTAVAGATAATIALAALAAAGVPAIGALPAAERRVEDDPTGRRAGAAAIIAASRRIWSQRPLRAVTVGTTIAFLGFGALPIAAAAAAVSSGRSGEAAGQVATAIAVGALAGSLAWARRREPRDPARVVLGALALSGLVACGLAGLTWPLLVLVAAAIGVLDAPTLIGTYATRTAHSPDHRRAMVFAIGASTKLGAAAIGGLVAGLALDGAATRWGLVAVGVVMMAAALVGAFVGGELRSPRLPRSRGSNAPHPR